MKTVKTKNKERVKTILRKVFFLSPVKTIGIAIPSYLWVVYHLLKEEKNPILAYLSYLLSAYALVITVTGIIRMVKWLRTGMKQNVTVQRILEKPTVDRLLHEKAFRTRAALYPGLLINLLYVGIKLSSGIYYRSAWFISLAVYYFALALMRFSLLRPVRKKDTRSREEREWRRYRICGGLLLVINSSMAGIVILAITKNAGFVYPGMMIYLMAMYTFYSVITAVINVVKYRKYGSPVLSAAKVISLTTALVAVFSLESAMLTQFAVEGQAEFRTIMTGCTGAVICLLIIGLALYMLITSTRKLHTEGDE